MKPPIILLHGALGSAEQLEPIKQALSEKFNPYSFDFSGHGGANFNPDGFSIPVFVEETLDFMNSQGLEKAHFFGYSMGGYVALKLAKEHPDSVDKIFTLATKFNWSPEEASKEVKNLNPGIIEEKIPKFAALLEQRHAPNDWKEVLRKTAQLMISLGDTDKLSENDLASIEQESMIGIGDQDVMVTINESRMASSLLKNARLHVFDGFKHPIEQIDADILCNEIAAFAS